MVNTVAPVTALSPAQCWELLNRSTFARLALSLSDRPEIFPVNYVVQRGTLVFRTAPGAACCLVLWWLRRRGSRPRTPWNDLVDVTVARAKQLAGSRFPWCA